MPTRLVIFDLDGTLLDTIGDLAAAANHMLRLRGLGEHTLDDYRRFVGNGILRLVERALPEPLRSPDYVQAARADFLAYYIDHIDHATVPYAGIPELLEDLAARGLTLAVASNKFQAGTEKLIRRYFPAIGFAAVLGQRTGVPLKPDPAVVHEILGRCGIGAGETLYVGDSGIDIATARAAGVRSAGVSWGFRARAELAAADRVVDHPAELLSLL